MTAQPPPSSSSSTQNDPSRTTAFNPNLWYRLRNASNPHKPCLDVINDGGEFNSTGVLKMAKEGYYSGQYWQFKSSSASTATATTASSPSPEDATGPYTLVTWWLGPLRTLVASSTPSSTSLDVPILPRPQDLDGRGSEWRVGSWGLGTVYIGCDVKGKFKVLDVGEDGREVFLRNWDEGRLTQRWMVEGIREIREEENYPRAEGAGEGVTGVSRL